ncbi:ATP-dependent RNA helicase HrpA [Haloechinothrix sp. LS1_15]|uniref:ATP-dependent RNA helicase HrpA n=1 Tax=Haloechinothrix sp. LS1_15 TaxID=2652248 RepID=UPI002944F9D7|nr:ATP-dependent RNA helicase HrpA [Haloechinothrix sp. LS1_15]MDV6013704.1 ATP-dependent RNA helicase HrpA [Haloechinothrix sp. LS1_15]
MATTRSAATSDAAAATEKSADAPGALRARLDEVSLTDRQRLRRRIDRTRKMRDRAARQRAWQELTEEVAAAEARIAARHAAVPSVSYPAELPVSQRSEGIAEAIRDNQVVIVAGDTGSGKTTQLPKICLELGRGVRGMIGHTQPRRIAARSVAERLASELGTEPGGAVGWKVRFTDTVGPETLIKVATDGILLAEIQHDPMLRAYDTLIIDEAHERSLNIDFLLGYVKRLLPRRPDLKVIITSATIEPERFARHFGDGDRPAPVVEVSGRTYPVEVRYRPVVDPDDPDADPDRDQVQAICDAVDELAAEGPGDMLVFLSGEREIRDTAEALAARESAGAEILPLYARLSGAEQQRVFQQQRHRRIVLATNVAETSLTVPGISYVIDAGTARISRYSHRLKVQRLPIEPVSQASAEQRKGRCGRIGPGVCIRLYSEEDFASRSRFTDPEILRTNLASVILQMSAARLGDIADFPFLDPPDPRQVTDGVQLLRELGALEQRPDERRDGDGDRGDSGGGRGRGKHSAHRLTAIGRKLARFPVDPRMARMVVEAEQQGCARQVMVIAAGLSIQDPRERPAEHTDAADTMHARFAHPHSDFLSYLNLWGYLRSRQRELSSSKFRRLCRSEFLNHQRVREWQDIYNQLRETATSLGMRVGGEELSHDEPSDPGYARIHLSVLSAMLSHIGLWDNARKDYLGARGARFAIFPGSALFRANPRWVMAGELVETSRLWGRVVARIQPEWIEKLAGHLVRRSYSEPRWERKRGAVMAEEKVTLYGVPIVEGRKVNYGAVDPPLCRELFIRHALVERDWHTEHRFFHDNAALLDEVAELEERARRRDILVDDETLFEFYDRRVGDEVVSARHFDTWWKQVRREQPELLHFTREMLINATASDVDEGEFPRTWRHGSIELPVTYQFEPGSDADGVTMHIPLAALNQVADSGAEAFGWQVPGLRGELITALIKALPKPIRKHLVPAPDTAAAVRERLTPYVEPIEGALARELRQLTGVEIPSDSWDYSRVPDHLLITFRVADEHQRTLGEGKDLRALRNRLAPQLRTELSRAAGDVERRGLRDWSMAELPRSFRAESEDAGSVAGFPALVDAGDAVDVRVLATPDEQHAAMLEGTRKLVLLNVPSPRKSLRRTLSNTAKLELAHNPHGGVGELLDDCIRCATDALITEVGGPAWDAAGFATLVEKVRQRLDSRVADTLERVRGVLLAWHGARQVVAELPEAAFAEARADMQRQLGELVYDGFVAATGWHRLPDVRRYLQAIERRAGKLRTAADRDTERMRVVHAFEEELDEVRAGIRAGGDGRAEDIGWMLQELRVSFFAQTLGTAYPVSEKRVRRALDELAG